MTSVADQVTAPSPTVRPSAGYAVMIAGLFLIALMAGAVLLGHCLPFPTVPVVREKLEQLAHYGDEYDVLFVGSSRVHFQVMPSVFDSIAREQGLHLRSFNAAVAAMVPPEDNYYLDQILKCPHHRLRWVFLEVMPLGAKSDPTLTGTRRHTYWHDWSRTRLLTQRFLQEIADAPATAAKKRPGQTTTTEVMETAFATWLDNLDLFMERWSNLGRGDEWLRAKFGLAKERKDGARKGLSWDGWAFPGIAKPITESEKRRTAYESAYADLLATPQRFDAGDAASWEALKIKIDRLTAEKITPILVIPPTTALTRYFPPQLAGQSLTILDLSDPKQYPEFFTLENRLDGMHLNSSGAQLFTETIARQFMDAVKKTGAMP